MTLKLLGPLARFSRSLAFGARLAMGRFPVAVLVVLVFAGLSNLAVESIYPIPEDDLLRLMTALYGAAVVSIAVRLAAESHGWAPALRLFLPVLAAVLLGMVIWTAPTFWIVAPTLTLAVTLSIPLAPFIARPDGARFWAFTLWTAVGMTLAFLSVLLFTLGLSAILEMVRFLFGVGLGETAYGHIYVTALTLVGPLFALGRIPGDYDAVVLVDSGDRLASGLRLLFDWVAAPLALVTAVILHLYAAKMAVLGEVPKNEIGWIVTFYAVLVLALRIAADPFVHAGASATRLFGRLWAVILVVPVGLLTYAVSLRILSEGVTLERYYLALGAAAALLAILVQAAPRLRGDIRWIAGLPIALLVLSCFGPWGLADVVGRSQMSFLEAAYRSGADGKPPAFDDARRAALTSRIQALEEVGEVRRALSLLPAADRDRLEASQDAATLGNDVTAALGLFYTPDAVDPPVTMASTEDPAFDTSGFDLVLMERYVYPAGANAESAPGADARMTLDGDTLVLAFHGAVDRIALASTLASIQPASSGDAGPATPPLVVDLRSAAGRAVRLRMRQASVDAAKRIPSYIAVSVLLRRGEWPARPEPSGPSLGGDREHG